MNAKVLFHLWHRGPPVLWRLDGSGGPDFHAACAAFRVYHPDKTEGLLNCCTVYTEKNFEKTSMYQRPDGNFGYRCHETITLQRELTDEGRLR